MKVKFKGTLAEISHNGEPGYPYLTITLSRYETLRPENYKKIRKLFLSKKQIKVTFKD